jgi:hypothetical protein
MPAGLQVFNDSGVTQIDETYRNAVLRLHQTVSNGQTVSLANCVAPIMAMYSTAGLTCMETGVAGSTYSWRFSGSGEVFVFDQPPTPPALHGFGLQVFTSAGALAFDAGIDQMRVAGVGSIWCHPFYNPSSSYPSLEQTLSTGVIGYHTTYAYNTIEAVGAGGNTGVPFTKTAGRKWAWALNGDPRMWTSYAASGQDVYRGWYQHYWSGDNFKAHMNRVAVVQSGETWPGARSSWYNFITWLDVTGIP